MYNTQRVLDKLFSRVGWKQPTQPEYAILEEPNTTSKSGRWFQDVYAAVTIQNIKDLQEDEEISDPDFNELLVRMQKSVILEMLTAVFHSREVVDTVQTFDRQRDVVDALIPNAGNFVGYKIDIARVTDFATILSSISLYFNQSVTFELKCFIDNSIQPIWTKQVTTVANELTVVDLDETGALILSYMNNKSRSSTFYIGYFQDDIGEAQAFDEKVLVYNYGCLWIAQTFQSAVDNSRFALPVTNSSPSYGLNLQFTSYKDMTNAIIANATLFDEAIGLQMACKVLELILTSTRSNSSERITKEMLGDIYKALNTERSTEAEPYAPGLKARYAGEIIKLYKSFFGQPKIETHSLPYAVYSDHNHGNRYGY